MESGILVQASVLKFRSKSKLRTNKLFIRTRIRLVGKFELDGRLYIARIILKTKTYTQEARTYPEFHKNEKVNAGLTNLIKERRIT